MEFRDRLLDILWRQWTSLGVFGHSEPWTGSVIDPEALLLLSCTVTRYDARLFDAALEWLRLNGRFINVHRIKRILKEEIYVGEPVLRAMTAVTTTSVHEAKWARMTREATKKPGKREALFFLKDGGHLPTVNEEDPVFAKYGYLRDRFETRGVAESFPPEPLSNLLLRLRALLGVNARCEILLFLLLNGRGSPRAMARSCYYFPATISKALAEMNQSGYVISRTEGRHRYYMLVPDTWKKLLLGNEPNPAWVVWARLFSALEQAWLFLDSNAQTGKSPLAQASSLRRILRHSVVSQFDRSGLAFLFGDDSAYPGEALIPFFVARVRTILDWMDHPDGSSQ